MTRVLPRDLFALLICLVICTAAATVGSLLTVPSLPGWYADIRKPAWNPPNSVFAPVWSTLFLMMALAVWLVWQRRGERPIGPALIFFGVQLILNMAWSGLFFTLHAPAAALVDVGFLWLAILATLIAFWRVRPVAGALLLPYLLWVGFAAALNFELWRLNG